MKTRAAVAQPSETQKPQGVIRLILPFPPSNNLYYRHVGAKVLLSKHGKAYRRAVAEACLLQLVGMPRPFASRLALWLVGYAPDQRARDIDNWPKAIQDSLQHAFVYNDDSQIDALHVLRAAPMHQGKVEVFIMEYHEQYHADLLSFITVESRPLAPHATHLRDAGQRHDNGDIEALWGTQA